MKHRLSTWSFAFPVETGILHRHAYLSSIFSSEWRNRCRLPPQCVFVRARLAATQNPCQPNFFFLFARFSRDVFAFPNAPPDDYSKFKTSRRETRALPRTRLSATLKSAYLKFLPIRALFVRCIPLSSHASHAHLSDILYPECRNKITSPSCTMYSLPSSRTFAFSRAAAQLPAASNSSQPTVSALMKCCSMSL